VLTTDAVTSSTTTPWVVAAEGEHPLLFNLRDGRIVRVPDAGIERIPLHKLSWGREVVIPNHPSITLRAWRGVPFMIIGSVPAQMRRVSDGSLIAVLADRCGATFSSPDGTLMAVRLEHVVQEYPFNGRTRSRLMRADAALYSTRTARKVATFAGAGSGIKFTAHEAFAYVEGAAEVHDLLNGASLTGRALQISGGNDWFAVQYGTTKSELWHDDGAASLHHPIARLPDGAVLIGADVTGRHVLVWEPNGATLLIAGDILLDLGRNPPATSAAVLRAACAVVNSLPNKLSPFDRFALGEPLRACGDDVSGLH